MLQYIFIYFIIERFVANVAFVIGMRQANFYFFDCQHAKVIWRIIYVATGLNPPRSINHILRNWLTCIDIKTRCSIFVGVATLMWVIWCTRKDIIFEKKFTSFMQAVFKGAYCLWFLSLLQCEDTIRMASKVLEIIALDIFAKNEWRSNNRFCL
jgi:hypothetical protein